MEDNRQDREIILPEELQRKMLEFFLKTSIPRKKAQAQRLSEQNDRSDGT